MALDWILVRVLVIDHEDSFTYNIVSYLQQCEEVTVDVVSYAEIRSLEQVAGYHALVLSPGPGRVDNPADIGLTLDIIRQVTVPILGICLGHQALVYAWGGGTELAPRPVHGETTTITHNGQGLFCGLENPVEVVRYHSLIATEIPGCLDVTARTAPTPANPEGLVMAVAHRHLPQWGVQFHPESVGAFDGQVLIRQFVALARSFHTRRLHVEILPAAADAAALFTRHVAGAEHCFWLDSTLPGHPDGRFSYLGVGQPAAGGLTPDILVEQPHPEIGSFQLGRVVVVPYEWPHTEPIVLDATRMLVVDHHLNWVYAVWYEGDSDGRAWVANVAATTDTSVGEKQALTGREFLIGPLRAHQSKAQYLATIARAMELIRQGHSYEVCLTMQLQALFQGDPLGVYAKLRAISPTPFGAYVRCGEVHVLSSSPERFLRCGQDRHIETRPIKGTRPRGADPATDEALRQELSTGEKERAENLMIVDLARHDLAQVAVPGSVRAHRLFEIESYATVHQLVSTVSATLAEGVGVAEVLAATFPGGSMTGAPKKRTMEIITALEGQPRGVYSGALGYVSASGAWDLSMMIRTIVIQGEQLSYGVGGAVLALSDPEQEYQELITKAAPLLRLTGQAFPEETDERPC